MKNNRCGNEGAGNIILADYDIPSDWAFRRIMQEVTGETWDVMISVANIYHRGINNVIRYIKYAWLPLRLLFSGVKYKKVIAWQQYFGFFLAAFCRLFRIYGITSIYIMEMIYKKKRGIIGKVQEGFIRYALGARNLKGIFVYSKSEGKDYATTFSMDKSMFYVIALGIEDMYAEYEHCIEDNGVILAPGRSNRDYGFLINAWDCNRKLTIVCDNMHPSILKEIRDKSIIVKENCYNGSYLTELARCHMVVVPLDDSAISSGQLVILQSMMMGKPVVVTRNIPAKEYFSDEMAWLMIEKTKDELEDVMRKLDDEETYRITSGQERHHFIKNHTIEATARSVASYIMRQNNTDKNVVRAGKCTTR